MTEKEIIELVHSGEYCLKVNPNLSSHTRFVNKCFPNRRNTTLVRYYKCAKNLDGYECSNYLYPLLVIDLEKELKQMTNLNINLNLI